MTAKEKAIQLVEKFYSKYNNVRKDRSFSQEQKRMALIAVDEILSFIEDDRIGFNWKDYYKEVKQEINKL